MKNKLITDATFMATCIFATGVKPFIPEILLQKIKLLSNEVKGQ